MNITEVEKKNLEDIFISSFDMTLFSIETNSNLKKWAQDEIDELIELNNEDIKRKRYEYFNIQGTTKDNFSESIFEILGNKKVLAGIRHAGGNVDIPFIQVTPGFSLESIEDLKLIKEKILKSFEVFSPIYIDIWCSPKWGIYKELETLGLKRQSYVVGSLEDINARNKETRLPNNYSLAIVKEDNFYQWYKTIYDNFHDKSPELKDWVPINSHDEMLESMHDGLLYYILDGKERIGLIQAENESLFGEESLYMCEILLKPEYKGKGIAPLAQIEFLKEVSHNRRFVWGTTDDKNQPSMRTALRVGRKIIRTSFMIGLKDL